MSGPATTSPQPDCADRGTADRAGALMAAVVGLLVSVPVTTGWAVGNLSPNVHATLTYDLGPYSMDPTVERVVGLSALAVTLLSAAALAQATRRHRLAAIWWAALTPAVLAGVVAAVAWRAATAGFVGATIGGGVLALIVGACLAGLLLTAAALLAVFAARRRPPSSGPRER